MTPKLILSLAMAFAIFSDSQALLKQGVDTEIRNSNRPNERCIRSLPLSRDVGASLIKPQRNTLIADQIRDLRGTSDGKSKGGVKKKKAKSEQSMSKKISKGEDSGGNDSDGSDGKNKKKSAKPSSEKVKSKGGKGKSGNDSDGSDGNDSPDGGGGNGSGNSEGTDSPEGDDDSPNGDSGNDSGNSEGTDSPEGDDFDLSDCDSYSNEWLSELASYCGDNLDDLSSCECPPARELLADGTLVCASKSELGMSPPACPEGCPVCEFCMVLEGCEDIYGL